MTSVNGRPKDLRHRASGVEPDCRGNYGLEHGYLEGAGQTSGKVLSAGPVPASARSVRTSLETNSGDFKT